MTNEVSFILEIYFFGHETVLGAKFKFHILFSEEADDVFNDSHISPIRNCSFASLSQKIDDQRYYINIPEFSEPKDVSEFD